MCVLQPHPFLSVQGEVVAPAPPQPHPSPSLGYKVKVCVAVPPPFCSVQGRDVHCSPSHSLALHHALKHPFIGPFGGLHSFQKNYMKWLLSEAETWISTTIHSNLQVATSLTVHIHRQLHGKQLEPQLQISRFRCESEVIIDVCMAIVACIVISLACAACST